MTKLDNVKRKKEVKAQTQKLELALPSQEKALTEVRDAIENLFHLLNGKEEYNFDKLAQQLADINKSLELQPYFDKLAKELKPYEIKSIDINGFTQLIKEVKASKTIVPKVDLEPLKKAIIRVEQRITESSIQQAEQAPDKYTPVRRVIKVGNRLVFDDGHGTGGASQGGGAGNVEMVGVYNATKPTLANGAQSLAQLSVNGFMVVDLGTLIAGEDQTNNVMGTAQKPVPVSTYSGSAFSARLNDVDIPVKASAGCILSVKASNINAALRYLQIFNKASAPAGGDSPVFSFTLPAGTATVPQLVEIGREFFGNNGHYLNTGISVGISTVADTFTAATVTDHIVNGTYI